MTLICAGTVVIDGQVCRPGWLQTSGRQILACGTGTPPRPADVNFSNSIVVPGFIDMHVHGGGGTSYTEANPADTARAAEFHLRHGTTTTLASLVTAPPAELVPGVRALAEQTRQGTIAGIHLEGPWLSPARCGAHDHTRMRDPDSTEIDAVLAAGGDAIRMVTLAPELPGSDWAIRRFVDAGVVVAVGHTDATYEQTQQAVALGATVGTHLFNAMPPLHHRTPGVVGAALSRSPARAAIIPDGIHLHPALLNTAHLNPVVTTDRVALASTDGAPRPLFGGLIQEARTENGAARLPDGTLAGSVITMLDGLHLTATRLVSNGWSLNGVLLEYGEMSAFGPSAILGLTDRGRIENGWRADLILLDRDLNLKAVFVGGRELD